MENYSARRERKPVMCNKEEAGGHYSKLNKSDTKGDILYDFIQRTKKWTIGCQGIERGKGRR